MRIIGTKLDISFHYKKELCSFYLLPTIMIFYRPDYFFETGVHTPAFGMVFKWLKFSTGYKIQLNPYYE
jgi:hypothetical protein